MGNIEFIVQKSPEECFEIIKRTIPSYLEPYNMDDPSHIKVNKYTYKIKNNNLVFRIIRIGTPPITLEGFFKKIDKDETKFTGRFKENVAVRILMTMLGIIMSFGSMLYIFLFLADSGVFAQQKLLKNIFTMLFSIMLVVVPLIYVWYIHKSLAIDREGFIKYLKDILL